ncbi:MAG: ATP-binding protein, partial [Chloroflexota bacterium]
MTATPVAVDSAQASLLDLRARLRELETRVRVVVDARRSTAQADDRFRGLYISDDDVDALLDRTPDGHIGPGGREGLREVPSAPRTNDEAILSSRVARLLPGFGLDAIDLDLLMVALAPDMDPRFERLYAYLQDDVTRRRASIGLALELCALSTWSIDARRRFALEAPLVAGGLLAIEHDDRPMLTRQLRVSDRVVDHLLGGDAPDASIAHVTISPSERELPASGLLATAELSGVLRRGVSLLYFRDRVGSAAASVGAAALIASEAVTSTLQLDLDRIGEQDDAVAIAAAAVREARLTDAGIVAGPIDGVAQRVPRAIRALADAPVPVLLTGRAAWEPAWSIRVPWVTDAPVASVGDRLEQWARAPADGSLAGLAEGVAGFRLSPPQIERAQRSAAVRAAAAGGRLDVADLQAGARAENAAGLHRLARRVEPRASWSDLVVPSAVRRQLGELTARARHRDIVMGEWGLGGGATHGHGVSALFGGDPGTGKTMSAEVVAAELGLDLYVIDLSSVVDKYIGETEKNLDRIFTEADRINGVLLFDEADAIFGQRSEVRDARDRYANVEIAFLLQRMEQFDGVAILTTNLRANMDDAFLRRLDAVIDFPVPDADDRLLIWRLHLPDRIPLSSDVELDFMAQRFELAGGHIRNICLTAAYLAAERDGRVRMVDIIRGTEREYGKLGRLTVEAEFGPYLSLLQEHDAP